MTDTQRILDSVRRLVRLLRLSDRAAQSHSGLSAAQLFVLSELGKESALSLTDLAERTRTDQSSVSVVVTRLVDAGLVSRDRAEDDARRLVLSLTRGGRAAVQDAPDVAQRQLLAVLESMPAAQRSRFAATFEAILDAMGANRRPPPMFFEDEGGKQRKKKRTR